MDTGEADGVPALSLSRIFQLGDIWKTYGTHGASEHSHLEVEAVLLSFPTCTSTVQRRRLEGTTK